MSRDRRAGVIFGIFGIVVLALVFYKVSTERAPDTNLRSGISNDTYKQTLYAYKTINVRNGAGTQFSIISRLTRGDVVKVEHTNGDWAMISQSGEVIGYVYKPIMETAPLPDFEIVSWKWYKDPSFGIDGSVIWTVEVRNNTNRYVEHLKVEFTSFDIQNRIITSDFSYISGLSPGGSGSTKSYSTYFGAEKTASIRIVP